MAFDKQLLAIIACPVCKGELKLVNKNEDTEQELVCKFDRLGFEIKENIPVLLEDQARTLTLDEVEAIK